MIRAATVLSKGRTSAWRRVAAVRATQRPASVAAQTACCRVLADHQQRRSGPSSPPAPLALALAAVAALASAAAPAPARAEAAASHVKPRPSLPLFSAHAPPPPARAAEPPALPSAPPVDRAFSALGKSLQASHERHMVAMARLLHNFETLAEEAEREARTRRDREDLERALDAHEYAVPECGTAPAGAEEEEDAGGVRVTDEDLAALPASPAAVWEIVDAFKGGRVCGREDVKRICRAAAAALRREPSLVDLSARCGKDAGGDLKSVTVVGDLHGHFGCSLVKILDLLGADPDLGSPWEGTGAVVFNGDFVDRGENNLEVILTLLLLKLAYPNTVYLNRGNHEDSVIATVYGCSDELQARYGDDTHDGGTQDIWKAFEDVFSSLPLAVRTHNAVVMHGGLPSADFRLAQIAGISSEARCRIKTMVEPSDSDETCRLVQNIMWSDPQPDPGVTPNEDRGCGVRFGPDVVRSFLAAHGLKYLIRSHEPVDAGYELLECDANGMSAVTVFSAASYPGGAGFNNGAIVRLHSDKKGGGDDISFNAYHESSDDRLGLSMQEKMSHTFKAFADVIAKNRDALEEEFEYLAELRTRRLQIQRSFSRHNEEADTTVVATSADVAAEAALLITPQQWADAMSFVLGADLPNVDWLDIQRFMAPGETIDYRRFLNLHCSLSSYGQGQTGMDDSTRAKILSNLETVSKVFTFLDVDGDGEVDRDEFCKGINELKKRNPDLSVNAEGLFDSIDEDGSGTIELSEFQQAFQAVDVPYHVAVMMTLDTDRSGTIDRHEFHEGVKLLNARLSAAEKIPETESYINALFDDLDDDKSGELDEAEFQKFIQGYYPH